MEMGLLFLWNAYVTIAGQSFWSSFIFITVRLLYSFRAR